MNTNRVFKKSVNLLTLASFLVWNLAVAAPEGGSVSGGSAVITQSGSQTNITQTSHNAVINWQGFDTAQHEAVKFNQPNSSSIALNRINSGQPTNFQGSLSANGQVWILNPSGVLFGANSKVDVAGLLVTTHNITDSNFMNGHYQFTFDPNSANAKIINNGLITAKDSGMVGLVAPWVENNGVITAHLGKVHLASGPSFVLDMYGDSLINFGSNAPTQKGYVSNTGLIQADGGKVYMTARTAAGILDNVISMSGTIQANAVSTNQKGEIVLHGGSSGVTKVSGKLKAKGGGHIETSGAVLIIEPTMELDAGVGGTWLIDPTDINIDSTLAASIVSQLEAGTSVTVDTNIGGSDPGDITVSSPIVQTTSSGAVTLEFLADNNIYINQEISLLNDAQFRATSTLGVTNIDANITAGSLQFYSPVVLTKDPNSGTITLTANDVGGIIFSGTIDSPIHSNLTTNTPLGPVLFSLNVGVGDYLTQLITYGDNTAFDMTGSGEMKAINQQYNTTATRIVSASAFLFNGNTTINGALTSAEATVDVTIAGGLTLNGMIGDPVNSINSLTVTDNPGFGQTAASFLNGTILTTGDQLYMGGAGPDYYTLTGNTQLASTNGGTIDFEMPLSGDGVTDYSLVINDSSLTSIVGNVLFGGLYQSGAINPIGSLTVIGDTEISSPGIIATNAQTYNNPVTVIFSPDLIITGAGGTIDFMDTVNGNDLTLTVVPSTGLITVNNLVTLDSLTVSGNIKINTNVISTNGLQSYSDGLVLLPSSPIDFQGSSVTFAGSVLGDSSATDVTISGALILANGNINSINTLLVTGQAVLSGDITTHATSGIGQEYLEAVTLSGNTGLGSLGGDIVFRSFVDGPYDLNIGALTGTVQFDGVVGGAAEVLNLTIYSPVNINTTAISTAQVQDYKNTVTINSTGVTLTALGLGLPSNQYDIVFRDTIEGPGGLDIVTPLGAFFESPFIGQNFALSSFSVSAGFTLFTSNSATPAHITTTGSQTYSSGLVSLLLFNNPNITFEGSHVRFQDSITSSAAENNIAIVGNLVTDVGSDIGTSIVTNIGTLTVSGSSSLGGLVITNGLQTYTGAVTINGSVQMFVFTGDITFGSTLDGPGDANIFANAGSIFLNDEVGSQSALSGVAFSATTIDITHATQSTSVTAGSQSYLGSVLLDTLTAITFTGGVVTFNGPVDSYSLVSPLATDITVVGHLNELGGIGLNYAAANYANVNSLDVQGTFLVSNNITTIGNQTYHQGLQIQSNDITLIAGGDVTFLSTVASYSFPLSLTINATGMVEFNGNVNYVNDLDVTGSQIKINASEIDSAGNQTYHSPVSLLSNTTLNSNLGSGGNIIFESTVDGAFALEINPLLGAVGYIEFNGAVGGTTELTSLNVLGSYINLNAPVIKTTGFQNYYSLVVLQQDVAITAGDYVLFENDITGSFNLQITTPANIGVYGTIGTTPVPLAGVNFSGSQIDLLFGSGVTTTGDQIYTTPLMSLFSPMTLTGANITVGSLSGLFGFIDNTVFNASGDLTFNANVGAINSSNASITANSNGITQFNGYLGSNVDTTFSPLNITVTGNVINFLSTVDGGGAFSAIATTSITLANDVGANGGLALFTSFAVTAPAITITNISGTGLVQTAGNQIYTGAVLLDSLSIMNLYAFDNTVEIVNTLDSNMPVDVSIGPNFILDVGGNIGGGAGNINSFSVVQINSLGGASSLGGNVNTIDFQNYQGPMTLTSNPITLTAGGNITVAGTIDATSSGVEGLIINSSTGAVELGASVGVGTLLSHLEINAPSIFLSPGPASEIDTTGNQAYNGSLTMGSSTIMNAGGTILFTGGTVSGNTLTINPTEAVPGVVQFDGPLNALLELTVTGSQININTNIVNALDLLQFNGPVVLLTDVNGAGILGQGFATFGPATLHFNGTVTGPFSLSVNVGRAVFDGDVNVASLDVTANQININTANMSAATDQIYTGAVVLGSSSTLTAGGNVTLNGIVDSDVTPRTLNVSAGGAVEFDGAVGGISQLYQLTISAGTGVILDAPISIVGLVPSALYVSTTTGVISINPSNAIGLVISAPDQYYNSPVVLAGDASINSTLFNVEFTSTVDSATGAQNLNVSGANAIIFDTDVGAIQALGSLNAETVSSCICIRGTQVITNNAQTYGGNTVFVENTSLTLQSVNFADITFNSYVTNFNLVTHADLTIDGNLVSNTDLTITSSAGFDDYGHFNSFTVIGTSIFSAGGYVQTDNDQLYTGAVTLVDGTSGNFISGTGNITFQSTLQGAGDVIFNAGGTLQFNGVVGGSGAPLNSIDATASSININTSSITTITDQTYKSAVVLMAPTVTLTGGGVITFEDTITQIGVSDLIIDSTLVVFAGNVNINSIDVTGDEIDINTGSITTTTDQFYNGAVVLGGGSANIKLTGAGNIFFASTITGAKNLIIDPLNVTFSGDVNTTSLDVTATNAININTANIQTSGDQIYNGPVVLGFNPGSTLTSTGGSITFNGTIDGNFDLVANALNAVSFNGVVGGTNPLNTLTTQGFVTNISANLIQTVNNQTYLPTFQTVLTQSILYTFKSTNMIGTAITFNSSISGAASSDLTIDGNLVFTGNGALNVSTFIHDFDVKGTAVVGGNMITVNNQTYEGAVTLRGDGLFSATNGIGLIKFGSTVQSGAGGPYNLTTAVVGTPGPVEFNGQVGVSTAANAANINNLNVTGSAINIKTSGIINTNGSQAYTGPVTLFTDTVLTSVNSGMSFSSTVSSDAPGTPRALTLVSPNPITLSGNLGVPNLLRSLTIGSLTVPTQANINTALIQTTQDQTYYGPVVLGVPTATVKLTGAGNIFFASTITGAKNLIIDPLNVTFSGDVNTTSLDVTATNAININTANIQTSVDQTYNGPVVLGFNPGSTLTSTGGNITFGSTVDGGFNLAINAPEPSGLGTVTFNGVVGGITALTSLTVNASAITLITNHIKTVGSQSYLRAVGGPAVVVSIRNQTSMNFESTNLSGTAITFGGVVQNNITPADVTINGNFVFTDIGNMNFGPTDGGGFIKSLHVIGTSLLGQPPLDPVFVVSIQTQNDQTYDGAVTIAPSVFGAVFDSKTKIWFKSTLQSSNTGPWDVYFNNSSAFSTPGIVEFDGQVGVSTSASANNINNLNVRASEVDIKTSGIINTNGTQTYTGPVKLFTNTVMTSVNSGMSFSSTVNGNTVGGQSLQLVSPLAVTLSGNIGNLVTLSALTIGSGLVATPANIATSSIATTTAQTYYGPVLFQSLPAITFSHTNLTSPNAMTFNNTVNSATTSTAITITGNLAVGPSGSIGLQFASPGNVHVASIAVSGTTLGPNTNTSGDQTYSGALTLNTDETMTSTAGNITYGSTVDGGFNLVANATAGQVTFNGVVGGAAPLNSLSISSVITRVNTTLVKTINNQTYNNSPSGLGVGIAQTNVNFWSTSGGNISFDKIVAGQIAPVNVGANVTITGNLILASPFGNMSGAIGAAETYSTLTSLHVTGTTLFSGLGGIQTFQDQTYDGTVTVAAPSVFMGTLSGGKIWFKSGLVGTTGANNVDINVGSPMPGIVQFDGQVGVSAISSNPGNINNLSVTGSEIDINTAAINTNNTQAYTGPVKLFTDTVLTTINSSINFSSTVDSDTAVVANARALTLVSPLTVTLSGNIGSINKLKSLTIGSGLVATPANINTALIQTIQDQTYYGPVVLGVPTATVKLTGAGNIFFASTITGAKNLIIDPLNVTFSGDVNTTSLDVTATNAININTANITTSAVQVYNGPVVLGFNPGSTLTSTGGDITFNGTINGPFGLTIFDAIASTGVTFNQAINIGSLIVNGTAPNSILNINTTAITTTGVQTYNIITALVPSAVITLTGSTVSFIGGSLYNIATPAADLVINGDFVLTANMSTKSGLIDYINSLTVNGNTTIGTNVGSANAVSTQHNQTYNGTVTLATNVTFGFGEADPSMIWFKNTLRSNNSGPWNATIAYIAPGTVQFDGMVGASQASNVNNINNLNIHNLGLGLSTTIINTAQINTNGSQTYSGPVVLNTDTTLTSVTSGMIFGSTANSDTAVVANARALTLVSPLTVTLSGNIGGINKLKALTIGSGLVATPANITTPSITSTTAQTYFGPVTLSSPTVTLTSGITPTITGTITFNNTINAASSGVQSLVVNASTGPGLGNVFFNGNVGTTPLNSLTVTSANITLANNVSVHTTGVGADPIGSQIYNGILTSPGTVTLTSDSENISLLAATGAGLNLIVNAPNGAMILMSGGSIDNINTLTVTGLTYLPQGGFINTNSASVYNGSILLNTLIPGDQVWFGGNTTTTVHGSVYTQLGSSTGVTLNNTTSTLSPTFIIDGNMGDVTTLVVNGVNIQTEHMDRLFVVGNLVFHGGFIRSILVQHYFGPVTFTAPTVNVINDNNGVLFGGGINFSNTPVSGVNTDLIAQGDTYFGRWLSSPGSIPVSATLRSFTNNGFLTDFVGGGSLTTTNGQTYGGPVYIDNVGNNSAINLIDSSLTGVTFNGAVFKNPNVTPVDLIITGNMTANAVIGPSSIPVGPYFAGQNGNLKSLSVSGTSGLNSTGGVTTTGSQTYIGPVTLGASQTISVVGVGNMFFGSTLTGPFNLIIDPPALLTFTGIVNVASLNAMATNIHMNGPSITTTVGGQIYDGIITLGTDVSLISAAGINFSTVGTTVDSDGTPRALVLNAVLPSILNGNIGNVSILSTLHVINQTNINTPIIKTTSSQLYDGVVLLGTSPTLTAGSVITFGSTVDGGFDLNLSTPLFASGQVTFNGVVGGTTALNSLTVGADATQVVTNHIRTVGSQTYNSVVEIQNQTSMLFESTNMSGTAIAFGRTLKNGGTAADITIQGNLVLFAAGNLTVLVPPAGAVKSLHVVGTTFMNSPITGGTAINTQNNQTYDGDFTIGGGVSASLSTLNAGAIRLLANVTNDGTGPAGLYIQGPGPSASLVELNGMVGVSQTSNINNLDFLSVAADVIKINSAVIPLSNYQINTNNAQTYTGPVILGGDATLTSVNSGISFSSTVSSDAPGTPRALALVSPNPITLSGNLGVPNLLRSLTIGSLLVPTQANINTALIQTTQDQTYYGPVVLGVPTATVKLTGAGNIFFASTITGAKNLIIDPLNVTFSGDVNTTSLDVTATNAININTANITTSANQTYNGPVVLGFNPGSTLTSTGGYITVNGTVNGAFNLNVNAAGGVEFNGTVGNSAALNTLTVTGAGATINASTITTSGFQDYSGQTVLKLSTPTTLTGSTIILRGPTLGFAFVSPTLIIAGNLDLEGAGNMSALGANIVHALTVTGSTTLNGDGFIAVDQDQTYQGPVTASVDYELDTINGGKIWFQSTVQGPGSLTINSVGTPGVVEFDGQVGVSAISVNPGNINNLSVTGSEIDINTSAINTNGTQTYTGPVKLFTNTVMTSVNSGMSFSSTVNGNTVGGQSLQLVSPLAVTLSGNIGNLVTLSALTIGSGTVATLATITTPNITTTTSQTYFGPVTVGNGTVTSVDLSITNIGGNITFNNIVNAGVASTDNLTISTASNGVTAGTVTFNGVVGGGVPLNTLTVIATGVAQTNLVINTSAITTQSDLSLNDAITLNASSTLLSNAGNITVGYVGAVNSASNNLTITATTGAVTFFGSKIFPAPLGALTINAASGITLEGFVTTNLSQLYNGNVQFTHPTTNFFDYISNNGDITFEGTLGTPTASRLWTIDVHALNGTATFNGILNPNSANAIYNFNVLANNIDVNANMEGSPLSVSGSLQLYPTTVATINGNIGDVTPWGSLVIMGGTTNFNGAAINPQINTIYFQEFVTNLNLSASTVTLNNQLNGPLNGSFGANGIYLEQNVVGTGTDLVSNGDMYFGLYGSNPIVVSLHSITVGSGFITDVTGGTVSTVTTQNYNGEFIIDNIGNNNAVNLNGSVITFNGAVIQNPNVTPVDLIITGNMVANAPIGPSIIVGGFFAGQNGTLQALTVNGQSNLNGGLVNTINNQLYSGPVLLGVNNVLTSNSGNITFNSTIDNTFDLTITANEVRFKDVVGGQSPLGALSVNANIINFDNAATSTTSLGTQTYTGTGVNPLMTIGLDPVFTAPSFVIAIPVVIAADTFYISTVGDIDFQSTVDGPANLTLTPTGTAIFQDDVGATTPLASLTVNGLLNVSGATVINTDNNQAYNDLVTLNNNIILTAGTAGCLTTNCVQFTLGTIGTDGITGPGFDLAIFTYDASKGPTGAGIAGTVNVANFTMGGTGGGDISPLVPHYSTVGGATATGAWDNTFIAPGATGLYCVNGSCTGALIITATDDTKVYGQLFTPTLFSTTGASGGDVISITLTSTFGSPTTATVLGGPYSIDPSNATSQGITNNHYTSITYVSGQLTVNPAPLTIIGTNTSKTYGQTVNFTGSEFLPLGLLNLDNVSSVTLNSAGASATAPVLGSPYSIVPSAAVGAGLSNYTITYDNSATLTVNPAPLTITSSSQTKNYGITLSPTTTFFTSTPLQNGESIGTVDIISTGLPGAAPAGIYPITNVSNALGGTFNLNNYSINYVAAGDINVIGGAPVPTPIDNNIPPTEIFIPPVAPNCGVAGCDNLYVYIDNLIETGVTSCAGNGCAYGFVLARDTNGNVRILMQGEPVYIGDTLLKEEDSCLCVQGLSGKKVCYGQGETKIAYSGR